MKRVITTSAAMLVMIVCLTATANAEAVKVEAVMSPKQQMKLDFKDGSGHFILMVQREGKSEGNGALAGASVAEYGVHDIIPGVSGEPHGYLVFAGSNGDEAYVKWQVQATFIPGDDGKTKLLDNGVWQIAGGTGHFKNLKGAGILHIKAVSPTDRRFILEGELTPAQ